MRTIRVMIKYLSKFINFGNFIFQKAGSLWIATWTSIMILFTLLKHQNCRWVQNINLEAWLQSIIYEYIKHWNKLIRCFFSSYCIACKIILIPLAITYKYMQHDISRGVVLYYHTPKSWLYCVCYWRLYAGSWKNSALGLTLKLMALALKWLAILSVTVILQKKKAYKVFPSQFVLSLDFMDVLFGATTNWLKADMNIVGHS